MTIRFVGGMWRRINGSDIRSFATFQEAVDNKGTAWEDNEITTDDIQQQLNK